MLTSSYSGSLDSLGAVEGFHLMFLIVVATCNRFLELFKQVSQSELLKTTEMYCLTVLEARGPKSRYQ